MSARHSSRLRGKGQLCCMIALISLLVLIGSAAVAPNALRLLPTEEVAVEIIDRDLHESGGAFLASGAPSSHGWNYFVIVRFDGNAKDGKADERMLRAPKALYDRALPGLSGLSHARLHVTKPFARPVAVSLERTSVIQPGSVLDKVINLNRSDQENVEKAEAGSAQYFSLLPPVGGTIVAGLLLWLLVGYLLWKLPGKRSFPWPVLLVCMILAAAGGTWWAMAG